jgi:putative tricarboxylic transport membrane protein
MSVVDRVVGVAALLGGILLAIAGWLLDPGTSKLPGPGFFPLLIAVTMGGLGLWLLLRPGRDEKPLRSESSRWSSFTLALASIIAYAVLLQDVGYLISTFGLLLIQFRWVEKQNWRLSLLTAGMAAIISLVVFRVFLKVPLPPGILPLPAGW